VPTYDYLCENCGHEFEKFQSIKARNLRKCPECGKNSLKRLLGTGAGIIFKGSGFYQTDYRSESYQKAAKKDKDTKSTTKSESKKTKSDSGSKDKCKTCPKKKK
jgi:putative FmdB family regulatory protein